MRRRPFAGSSLPAIKPQASSSTNSAVSTAWGAETADYPSSHCSNASSSHAEHSGRGARRSSRDAVVPVACGQDERSVARQPSGKQRQQQQQQAAGNCEDLVSELPLPPKGPWSPRGGSRLPGDAAAADTASMPGCIGADDEDSSRSNACYSGSSIAGSRSDNSHSCAVASTSGRPAAAASVSFAVAPPAAPATGQLPYPGPLSPRSDGLSAAAADGRQSPGGTADNAQQRAKSRLARSTLAGADTQQQASTSEPNSASTSGGGAGAGATSSGNCNAAHTASGNAHSSYGSTHAAAGNAHSTLHSMASVAAMAGVASATASPRGSMGGGMYAPPTVSGLARLLHLNNQQPYSSGGALSRTGSVASVCSLGGRRVRLHVVTFNMNSKVPEELPDALVGAHKGDVDLYVFGSQESGPIPEWERAIQDRIGEEYSRYASESIWGIHLVVFAHAALLPHLGAVKSSSIAAGIGNVLGNKGGAALSLTLGDLRLLFVCAHFAAHDDKVERRNADYHRIRTGLFSSAAANGSGGTGPSTVQKVLGLKRAGGSVGSGLFQWGSVASVAAGGLVSERSGSWTLGTTASLSVWDRNTMLWAPPIGSLSSAPSASSDSLASDSLASELEGHLRASSCPNGTQRPTYDALRQMRLSGYVDGGLDSRSCSMAGGSQRGSTAGSSCGGSDGDGSGAGSSGYVSEREEGRSGGGLMRAGASGLWRSFVGGSSSSAPTLTFSDKPDATEDHDVTFWLGDLNYRINGNKRSINYLIRSRLHEVLHANDQLRIQQKKGRVFQGYQEAPIHFPPTFKLQPRSTRYSEQRVPSWTDRILWKVRPHSTSSGGGSTGGHASDVLPSVAVKHTYYQSVPECDSSDHRPVVAGFDLSLAVDGSLLNMPAGRSSGGGGDAKADGVARTRGCSIM